MVSSRYGRNCWHNYLFIAISIILICIPFTPASAYLRSLSSAGTPLFWADTHLNIAINPLNRSGLDSGSISGMFQNALNAWKATGANVNYSYSVSSSFPTTSGDDGVNAVFFTSQSSDKLSSNVIALTEVYYYPSSGTIAEFDMLLNDDVFTFTNQSGDTQFSNQGKIYLQDVVTHELGHAYGLDHSLVGESTMFYTAFSGQFQLKDDDTTAMRTTYPNHGMVEQSGSITGTVQGKSGGVFGTHVVAINENSGKIMAGTLANSDGSFRIGDLPAGNYVVMMEPLKIGTANISSYWQNINHNFCSGSTFARSFYRDCNSTGKASGLNVSQGRTTYIGTLAPQCNPMGNSASIPNSINTAKIINSNTSAVYGTFTNAQETHYYRIPNISGSISARAISYALFSPVDVQIELLDANGQIVAQSNSIDNVEAPMPGGLTNYDSLVTADNLPPSDYFLKIHANSQLLSSSFPGASRLVDNNLFYLVTFSLNNHFAVDTATDMGACVSLPNTPQKANTRAPASASADFGNNNNQGSGCGMIYDADNGGQHPNTPIYQTSLFLLLCTAFVTKFLTLLARKPSKR